MKKTLAIILWVIAIALWMQNHQTLTNQLNIPAPYQSLYEEVLAPVVKIRANGATGSGVIISDTYILTAAHVVGNEKEVTVYIYDYEIPVVTIKTATVIITDTIKDLALLRLKPNTQNTGRQTLVWTAKLAPRNYKPYLFTEVYAVGCSLGFNPRPSEGIVSAVSNTEWEISAPILPGNSGGGVFLKDTHRLIGIAVWVRVYHGQLITTMAGIVPIHEIYDFLESTRLNLVVYPEDKGRQRPLWSLKKTPDMNSEEDKRQDLTSWSGRGSDGAIGTRGPGGPTLPMKGGEKQWHQN